MIQRAMRRERNAWRALEAALPRGYGCTHPATVPVHAQPTDELVAHLCPDCDAQLPADWSAVRQSIRVQSPRILNGAPVSKGSPYLLEAGERVVRLHR